MRSSDPAATPGATDATERVAVVFPGQGSQRPGMAAPWRGHPAAARWAEANDVLGRDVARLGSDADADELREPASCQIALFVHQAVLWDAWRAHCAPPDVVAGHSLGEYNALYAAGVLSFAAALQLVDVRARATQAAAATAPGGMAACLGCDPDDVARACRDSGAYVANDNAPGQLVVAGSLAALELLEARLEPGRGRVMRLAVGAAYHSPHMQAAVPALGEALDAVTFAAGSVPVVANADAALHGRGTDWPDLLRRQLVTPVRWRETLDTLVANGVSRLVELGATAVLSGLAKRAAPGLRRTFVGEPAHMAVAA